MSTNTDSLDNDLQGKYLKAPDIEDIQPVVWTIVQMIKEPVGVDLEVKRQLIFAEHDKPLILNITMIRALRDLYGSNPENFKGKSVTLFNTYTDYNGKTHRVIRIAPAIPKKLLPSIEAEFAAKEADGIPM